MNKLVKENLVRGLPSNTFENDHTCVACQKGKQHKATCKAKLMSSISQPLQVLHMDLFGPTSVMCINHKKYCLVVTDDFSRSRRLDFIRPFGCPVTILDTLDPLGKFKGKADEGFLVGYSITSKAFRVFNTKTRKVEENFHVRFLKNKPNVAGTGPNWLFDIDSLTNSMNCIPVSTGNQTDKNTGPQDTNGNVGTHDNVDAGKEVSDQHHIMLPLWSSISYTYNSSDDKAEDNKPKDDTGLKTVMKPVNKEYQTYRDELDRLMSQEKEASDAADSLINDVSTLGTFSVGGPSSPHPNAFIPNDLLHVWRLVDLPYRKKDIRTKWVYRNKKDERGIVIRNKARLVAQGHKQEEGIDYDEVFAHVARIEAIKIFLAFASFIGFIVYQMDVKRAFLYGKIEEEVYNGYRKGIIDKTLFIKTNKDDIMLVQIPYKLHGGTYFLLRTVASTPIETQKPLVKDEEAADVDVNLYRYMIESLMYLTASRTDIIFAVYACSRFQVTPKLSHLHAMKRIFGYLKGQPKLGLWYPRDSPFDIEAYSNSDYAGSNLDRKSTTGEYVAAANCCGQVLWIQN
nr:hypothetical protein [Tanacetum cinerariifolium]